MFQDYSKGLIFSILGHCVLFYYLSTAPVSDLSDFGKPIVYSISIESGSKIGGITQLPKKDSKQEELPPKNVKQEAPKEEEQVKEEKKEPPKEKEPEAPEEKPDAEVSLAEKKKEEVKPTPKPKPKATPKAKPKPKPKPKPKAKPKAKPKPKPKPKPKKPSLAEINKKLQAAVQRYTGESTDAGGSGFGSAGGTGSGRGGGIVRPPEFFRYQKRLEAYIKAGWRWHDTKQDLKARICFNISERGALSNIRPCGSSGSSNFDDSAIRAVTKAHPVPIPPSSVYIYFKQVRMTFSPLE